jgi:hypothetical protein
MSRKRCSGQKFPGKKPFIVLFVVCLAAGAVVLGGCETDPFVDTHELNPDLIGTWMASGEGWTDTYRISATNITHPEGVGFKSGTIAYVYNFNETSGSIIVKRPDNKYTAVFFKNLSGKSVLLGDAFGPAPDYADPAVSGLEEAKTKFGPENAGNYGGADAQTGTPQIKQ